MAQFALSWDRHKQNICHGLSCLQQNGEFVDMTLAADGHHVKVHQMVMSLGSPYIKDLITSAQCPHPIIFLNKVSYATLLSILEYIYTGEVIVEQGHMDELIQAGRELHIKGLEDVKIDIATQNLSQAAFAKSKTDEGRPLAEATRVLWASNEGEPNDDNDDLQHPKVKRARKVSKRMDSFYISENEDHLNDCTCDNEMDTVTDNETDTRVIGIKTQDDKKINTIPIQYTISNQGSMQLIVNRYIYNLRYTSVRDDGTRRWQCSEARRGHCKAQVFTKSGVIIQRSAAHNHPFHDKRILKKVQENCVYSGLNDVEAVANKRKSQNKQETKNTSLSKSKTTDLDETTDAE